MSFFPRNHDEEGINILFNISSFVLPSSISVYLHKLASVLRLGRESIVTRSTLKTKNVKVNLWKPALYPCSTTKKVADLNIGPLGLPGDDDYNLDDTILMECDTDDEPYPHVKVTVDYYITTNGKLEIKLNVDASAMVVVLPRIGIFLNIINQPIIIIIITT